MPTLDPLYTDHQSPNLLKYHVVRLTRSNPAPTISWCLHSRLGLARYWRMYKCCVTYSLTNILGKGKVCFRSPKIFPGAMPRTLVLGERKFCFRSPKMYQNSPTAMQNSKIFPGTIPRTFVSGAGKFVFVLRKFTQTLLYSNAEFTNPPRTIPRTPVLGERKVCFRSPKMYQNSPTAMQNS